MQIHSVTPNEAGIVTWPNLTEGGTRRSVVTVGTFDGMHLGHQHVLRKVVDDAKASDALSVVILFDPRPALVHEYAHRHNGAQISDAQSANDSQEISSVNQRVRLMENFAIDHVIIVHYTLAFAARKYMFFLGQLTSKLGMRTLVLGSDATMGEANTGTVDDIDRLAQATRMFELDIIKNLGPGFTRISDGELDGVPVSKQVRVWSSSNLRYLLSQGDTEQAKDILGHHHLVEGKVVHGEQRGRELGFPTANLGGKIEGFMPQDGVYAGWLIDCNSDGEEQQRYISAISIGTKETFESQIGKQSRLLEAYAITPEWIDLYDHHIRIEFAERLREQVKFKSVEELVQQMKSDSKKAEILCKKTDNLQ